MNFPGRLPDQKQAARDQDQVAPGKAVPEQAEKRGFELHDEGNRPEQNQPHDQRKPDADLARRFPALWWQLGCQDRDEDQVVDAEDHLHGDQGQKCGPGGRVDGECGEVFHEGSG